MLLHSCWKLVPEIGLFGVTLPGSLATHLIAPLAAILDYSFFATKHKAKKGTVLLSMVAASALLCRHFDLVRQWYALYPWQTGAVFLPRFHRTRLVPHRGRTYRRFLLGPDHDCDCTWTGLFTFAL